MQGHSAQRTSPEQRMGLFTLRAFGATAGHECSATIRHPTAGDESFPSPVLCSMGDGFVDDTSSSWLMRRYPRMVFSIIPIIARIFLTASVSSIMEGNKNIIGFQICNYPCEYLNAEPFVSTMNAVKHHITPHAIICANEHSLTKMLLLKLHRMLLNHSALQPIA